MTVHAENMLDFIERYWAYVDGDASQPSPPPPSSAEHAAFKEGLVPRYEFMKSRTNTAGEDIKTAFHSRHESDISTAK
jgi:hypothetical protein